MLRALLKTQIPRLDRRSSSWTRTHIHVRTRWLVGETAVAIRFRCCGGGKSLRWKCCGWNPPPWLPIPPLPSARSRAACLEMSHPASTTPHRAPLSPRNRTPRHTSPTQRTLPRNPHPITPRHSASTSPLPHCTTHTRYQRTLFAKIVTAYYTSTNTPLRSTIRAQHM
jgi:hypothetical protein